MATLSLKDEILDHISAFSYEKQRLVMEYITSIESRTIRGVPGKEIVRYAGRISQEDLTVMTRAIQTDCEQVDDNEW